MKDQQWNPTTEGNKQKPSEVKSVLVLTDESPDIPKTGVCLPMLGWYVFLGNELLKKANVMFWRDYELPK